MKFEKQLNSRLFSQMSVIVQLKCVGVEVHSVWSHQGEKKKTQERKKQETDKKNPRADKTKEEE